MDGGSTQSIAQGIKKYGLRAKGVKGGGYDLTPVTQQLLAAGQIDFTIDQQPYLQGFLPILELYLYKVSQSLTGIADVNTGLKFLDKTTVAPYNSTKSRYEGTSSAAGVAEGLAQTSGASDGGHLRHHHPAGQRPPVRARPRAGPGAEGR